MTPSSDLLGAAGQRLIDVGLSGVGLLALAWAFWKLWEARDRDRIKADERYEAVQEKRIAEQRTALDAIAKVSDTLDRAYERETRSHQQ